MIMLDTHVIIWNALSPKLLSDQAKIAIQKANLAEGMLISDISLWEIGMLFQKKRIEVDIDYLEFIQLIRQTNKYLFQKITPEIANLSTIGFGADINSDPADRIIAATSVIHRMPLVTADKNLIQFSMLQTIW